MLMAERPAVGRKAKASLVCPICERELTPSESLRIGYDKVGSLIVQHFVHSSVPTRGSVPDNEWYGAIFGAPTDDYDDPGRHICGRAGFRTLEIDGKKQGSSTR